MPSALADSTFMRQRGDHTRSTDLWFIAEDEHAFSDAVASRLPTAVWRCDPQGPFDQSRIHLHPTLSEALDCGGPGIQALLPLPIDETRSLAAIQFLRAEVLEDDFGPFMRSGRLAVKWNELATGTATHHLLTAQTKSVWDALREVSEPAHVVTLGEQRSISGMRVGMNAREWILSRDLRLARSGLWRGRLHAGTQR